MENIFFIDKDAYYYNFEKFLIAALIPEGPNKVLDIGCATGRLGRKLRASNKAGEMVGVEIFAPAAEEAAKYYDKVYQGDIEMLDMPYDKYFDYVVCGDILEHLCDPWATVRKVHLWLKDEGILLSSIPNIRYWRILRDLIVHGKWEYTNAGILDNTHLRFFTRSTFFSLLRDAQFTVLDHDIWIGGKKQALFNRLTCGMLKEFLGSQVMVKAKKRKPP
jgi:2-polyprenyl-3-methyl-5-hydroxy-6-metoxy-1,4-benzoquinol methylase